MRLNIGCGNKRLPGYVNIDRSPRSEADLVFDLEIGSWPFDDNSVDEILAHHILEHIRGFEHVVKEIYRVLKIGGKVDIRVPHPRHDAFLGDPTHYRPVMPGTLDLFSKKSNAKYRELGFANTPMAEYHGVDMELKSVSYTLENNWKAMVECGELTMPQAIEAIGQFNNVASEIAMIWEKAS